jgi:hypothetical protein
MEMQNYMKISDFQLAVTLSTLGFQLEDIDRTSSERYQFCFRGNKKLDETIQAFWRGELRLEPKALLLNHKLLKSRIYSAS